MQKGKSILKGGKGHRKGRERHMEKMKQQIMDKYMHKMTRAHDPTFPPQESGP